MVKSNNSQIPLGQIGGVNISMTGIAYNQLYGSVCAAFHLPRLDRTLLEVREAVLTELRTTQIPRTPTCDLTITLDSNYFQDTRADAGDPRKVMLKGTRNPGTNNLLVYSVSLANTPRAPYASPTGCSRAITTTYGHSKSPTFR